MRNYRLQVILILPSLLSGLGPPSTIYFQDIVPTRGTESDAESKQSANGDPRRPLGVAGKKKTNDYHIAERLAVKVANLEPEKQQYGQYGRISIRCIKVKSTSRPLVCLVKPVSTITPSKVFEDLPVT